MIICLSSLLSSLACQFSWLLSLPLPYLLECKQILFFLLLAYHLPFLLRADIDLALERASAFDEAPQACKDNSSLVGLPLLSLSGPGMLPMRARNDARRGLSPALTGAFKVPPVYEARPLAFNPP